MLTKLFSQILGGSSPRTRIAGARTLDALLQEGYGSQCAGDEARAETIYRRAYELEPSSVDARYLLGALLGKRGLLGEAAALLQWAVKTKPDFADAHAALGNVFLLQGDRQAAAASYRDSIRLDPENVAAHSNLGLLFQRDGDHIAALRYFTRAHELAPEQPDALKNVTLARIELEQFDAALSLLHQEVRKHPDSYEALTCLGFTLQKMHRADQALGYYQKARQQNNSDAELLNNLGIVLQDLGRLDEAIECYDLAVALRPGFELASWHRSLAYLLRHDFARGWADYDLRLLSVDRPRRPETFPRWDGTDLAGRRLLVYAEQGLGDEIMFSSCLPQVIAASGHCEVECSPKLQQLFCRSFPQATVYATTAAGDFSQRARDAGVELQAAMGSLPRYLRRSFADFPQHSGYLRANPERIQYWRARLAALSGGLKVGISWQGGTLKTRRTLRSLPLASWLPILRNSPVQFINLQYTDSSAEIASLKADAGIDIVDWREARDDYEDTAALVAALDLVISVCTAVIHLGGALGKPVWVMAPYSPEWRYGISGEKMPWYPSVRIFRQPEYAAWEPVIGEVGQSLRRLAAAGIA